MVLLDGVGAAFAEAEKREVLAQVRGALADAQAGGVRVRITLLARQADILVEAAQRVQIGSAAETESETFARERSV
jgi:hypothetical protein